MEKQPPARAYRPDIPYVLPKDEGEVNRLDFQHYILKSLLHGNYRAPLNSRSIRHILDVGCGTGLWCREMALAFPQADVLGIDIESQLPKDVVLPNKFHFQQGNILHGLNINDASIDYTHQRLLVGALPADQWMPAIEELVRVTRAGGWIELVEGTDTFNGTGPHMQQFLTWSTRAARTRGIDASIIRKLPSMFDLAGLSALETQELDTPLGAWGGRYGKLLAQDTYLALQGLQDFVCSMLDLSPHTFQKTLVRLPDEWEEYQTSFVFLVTYGRK